MADKKVAVWTDVDLDGAMCLLVLKWVFGAENLEVNTCNAARLREEMLKWLANHKFSDYSKVIISDLDTSVVADLIDVKNVEIHDHHESHMKQAGSYLNAIANVLPCKSAAEQVFQFYKKQLLAKKVTSEQLKLLALVSDYDSYTLELKDSKNLSIVYWSQTGNRAEQFCRDFYFGFKGFNQQQQNAIILYKRKLQDIISNLQLFQGKIKDYKVISCFCDTAHNDVATHIVSNYKADVVMLVNPKTQTVSFRKSNGCKINLSELAAKLCEGGGGHEDAAGGKISEKFLLFTKTLSPYESN